MDIRIRGAQHGDEPAIVELIRELGDSAGGSSPITAEFVRSYLAHEGSGALLADAGSSIVGLLSYSVRPDLYHAGLACMIEELVVHGPARSQGIGGALMSELLERMAALGCVEVSVSALTENVGALRFYRSHGLMDDAVLLEKHL